MNGRDILMVTIGFMSGIMLCSIYPFLTNSLGFNTKENFHDVSRALVLSPSSSTADPEEALFGIKTAISFNDTDYTTKAKQFFNNICYHLNQDPNFKFDFCLEKQLFHVSDVFGAPSHAPVHSGVVLTNPYLQLNIHIDLAPDSFNPPDQKFNVINFKVTKGLVQGQFRGYTYGSLTKIIEMVKLSMNELGNNYSVLENNCIRFKDILVKQLKEISSIIAVGNPGVGKSTILNSLAEELLFKSGTSFGGGLTYQMDERFDKNERRFFDTPGLADRRLREPAGQAITQALKKGGEYKIIFFLRTQSGRAVTEDITTLKLVLDSAPEIGDQYGIVINKVPSRLSKKLMDKEHPEHKEAFLTQIFANIDVERHCSWSNIIFLPIIDEVDEENDKVIPVNELKTIYGIPFKNYVTKYLISAKLTQGKANNIAIHDFEKLTEEIEGIELGLRWREKIRH